MSTSNISLAKSILVLNSVTKGYGVRWRIESLFSAVKRTFGESVRATSIFRQVVEAKFKFWAYAWMVHLSNSLVGIALGIRV